VPELPEVEVVRTGLEPAVHGAVIRAVEVFEPRSLRRHDRLVMGEFAETLAERRILAAVRRGKYLWFPLGEPGDASSGEADPVALVGHLGMSGQLLLRLPGAPDDRNLRIRLHLDRDDNTPRDEGHYREVWVNFVDQRIFGSLAIDRLVPTDDAGSGGAGSPSPLIPESVRHIARDPLDEAFGDGLFFERLSRRRTAIKRALLDQRLVSGIGNIYADEALWAARIHYDQPAHTISRRKARDLLTQARLVLEKALAEGGTSFDAQYLNVNGEAGYFAHSLNAYGRQGRPCPRCGRVMVREAFMNRSSHLCPRCQRLR